MLEPLTREHSEALLAFELENRDYFARSVADRGDAFYSRFHDHLDALLADQSAGICRFHVLVQDDGSVIGRFNLYDLENRSAELGYRVAERVSGRGLATESVRALCALAAARYGLRRLTAMVREQNAASERVLLKSGFSACGTLRLNGHPATLYERALGQPG